MADYKRYCEMRDARNIKDADVARATGIGKSTFSDWKSGRSVPKNDKLQLISDYFGISLDYMMGKSSDPFARIDGLPNYMFNAATGTLIPTKDNSSIVQSAEKMPIESIFDKQDILNFSDEAKQVAIGFDSAPDNVKKAIQALLESQKPGL